MKKYNEFMTEDLNNFLDDPSEEAASSAERLGLKHVGFGKYEDKKGNISHRLVNGKLTSNDKAKHSRSASGSNNTLESITKAFGKQTKEIHSTLISTYVPDAYTDEELDSIKAYTDRAYVDINAELTNIENADNEEILYYIENLDTALSKIKTPIGFHVYVCMDMDGLSKKFVEGDIITLNGFRSTSIDPKTIVDSLSDAVMPAILQILVPINSDGMYIEDYSVSPDEYEFLLPRGSTIRIDEGPNKISADDGDLVFFDCTLVVNK